MKKSSESPCTPSPASKRVKAAPAGNFFEGAADAEYDEVMQYFNQDRSRMMTALSMIRTKCMDKAIEEYLGLRTKEALSETNQVHTRALPDSTKYFRTIKAPVYKECIKTWDDDLAKEVDLYCEATAENKGDRDQTITNMYMFGNNVEAKTKFPREYKGALEIPTFRQMTKTRYTQVGCRLRSWKHGSPTDFGFFKKGGVIGSFDCVCVEPKATFKVPLPPSFAGAAWESLVIADNHCYGKASVSIPGFPMFLLHQWYQSADGYVALALPTASWTLPEDEFPKATDETKATVESSGAETDLAAVLASGVSVAPPSGDGKSGAKPSVAPPKGDGKSGAKPK